MRLFIASTMLLCFLLPAGAQQKRTPSMSSDDMSVRKIRPAESDPDENEDETKPEDQLKAGQKVILISVASDDSVFLFTNEQAFEDAYSAGDDRRRGMITQMLTTGRILDIPNGSSAVVVETKKIAIRDKRYKMVKLRILSGPQTSRSGWVFQSDTKKKED